MAVRKPNPDYRLREPTLIDAINTCDSLFSQVSPFYDKEGDTSHFGAYMLYEMLCALPGAVPQGD